MNPESAKTPSEPAKPGKDYAKASPEEIMADIERTRAHMDETLEHLGKLVLPGRKGKAAAWGLATATLGALAWLAFRVYRGRNTKHRPRFRWHEARVLE